MNKHILQIVILAAVLGFTSCSDSSQPESESVQTSTEQKFAAVTSEEEKNTEIFSNDITSETTASFSNIDSDTSTTTAASVSSITYEVATVSENTETDLSDDSAEPSVGYFDNVTYKFTAAPFAADVNDYADKEIAAIAAFTVCRDEIYDEYGEYYSALIFYTDGTCVSGVFRDEHGINEYLANFTTIYDADEIICFDVIGSIDPDISEQLNECLNLIDPNSEWAYYDGYKPYDPNEPEAYPAVVVTYDYDLVHFLDNEVNIFSSYKVKPLKKFEDAILYAELDDNCSRESRDFLIETGIVDYWLENYAWKIGE